MSIHYTFKWPKGPEAVTVTGTFDDWSKSLPLVKEADGSFALQVPLPPKKETVLYKYVVDGIWKVNTGEKITRDEEGNENNVLAPEDLVGLLTVPGALIPETGLQYELAHGGAMTDHHTTDTDATQDSTSKDLKTTVLPKEEPKQASLAGEPGIYIPQDKETLSAFEKFENTDPRTLNEDVSEIGTANTGETLPATPVVVSETVLAEVITPPTTGALAEEPAAGTEKELSPEDKEKQKKKVKRTKYKAKKKAKAAEANGTGIKAGADESKDISSQAIPVAAVTGNEATSADYVGEIPRVTENDLRKESLANDQLDKEVREEFAQHHDDEEGDEDEDEYEDDEDEEPVRVPVSRLHKGEEEGEEEAAAADKDKNDHTAAKVLGGAGLGGLAGAGVGPALGSSEPTTSGDAKAADQPVAPLSATDKPVSAAAFKEDTSPIVASDDAPKTLDPKATPTVTSNLDSEPLVPPKTGSTIPETGEGKEVDASPVSKDVSKPAAVATGKPVTDAHPEQEEEIIVAKGDKKDILAAVEASEGPNITLEEIKPTKSQEELLTTEAKLAAEVDGPITIEPVAVPKETVASVEEEEKGKDSATDAAGATGAAATPTKATPAAATTKETPKKPTPTQPKKEATKTPAKKAVANGTKEKEEKKGGFRKFLKKVFQ
ncbi:uncharacterized protein LODBEIA_P12940 [Lodderomyces beijingensis]|uniref:AMP-activated protein kinase glycogen-binding domain-containing protein n=1 Tax=Lodderomyces beijingensis TaxID=1775926 RepID=A0ABP0ZIP9_9ASCO